MTETISRRGALKGLFAAGASGALAIAAPVAAEPRVVEKLVPAEWAEEWPPTAVPEGRLVRCDEAPGYYTTNGETALFYGAATFPAVEQPDGSMGGAIGVSGFPVEREIVPPEGLHVREVYVGWRHDLHAAPRRYAVVRHKEG